MTEPVVPIPHKLPRKLPRARMYLRLLWIIPGLILLSLGLWKYLSTEDNGTVTGVRLTTKSGLVGEAAEAVQLLKLTSPDLYLRVKLPDQHVRTDTFEHTPVGNGLAWKFTKPRAIRDIREIEVWDHHSVLSDKMQDRVTLNSGDKAQPSIWSADGQTFHFELDGARTIPPPWAIPTTIAGGALTLIVLLRFVWDQAI